MRQQIIHVLAAVLASAVFLSAAEVSVTGMWVGTENGLPAVELTLHDDHGQISGTIGFYFQIRGDDGKWHSDGKAPFTVPLLSPELNGNVLTFETIHHKQHGSPELGPNNRYRVTFISAKEARLRMFRHGEPENDAQPGLSLTRRE